MTNENYAAATGVEPEPSSLVPMLLSGVFRVDASSLRTHSLNTCVDFMPAAVSVKHGVVITGGTRVTEVNRETTDDR